MTTNLNPDITNNTSTVGQSIPSLPAPANYNGREVIPGGQPHFDANATLKMLEDERRQRALLQPQKTAVQPTQAGTPGPNIMTLSQLNKRNKIDILPFPCNVQGIPLPPLETYTLPPLEYHSKTPDPVIPYRPPSPSLFQPLPTTPEVTQVKVIPQQPPNKRTQEIIAYIILGISASILLAGVVTGILTGTGSLSHQTSVFGYTYKLGSVITVALISGGLLGLVGGSITYATRKKDDQNEHSKPLLQ